MRSNLPWNRKRERTLSLQGGCTLCDMLIDELLKMEANKKNNSAGKRAGFRHVLKLVRGIKLTLITEQTKVLTPGRLRRSFAWRPWKRAVK